MGVPRLYKWLSRKYQMMNHGAHEEKPKYFGDRKQLVDWSKPNPNHEEFDNLYLDMNCIIHPCSHPESKPAPKTYDEMMIEIFAYIDRILSITRPRKLIYMAIDGVAPRAKMNQQRSRRFRSGKESEFKHEEVVKKLKSLGADEIFISEYCDSKFDSNCITPGTEFMLFISESLRYYIIDRITNHPAWRHITVILSDGNIPGEGEHKIMDFIRMQRLQSNYDPNTRHILHGADADLMMLGLATHEAHFTVLREEFKPNNAKPCDICKEYGHDYLNCTVKAETIDLNKKATCPTEYDDVSFIFIRLYVLKMYLFRELNPIGLRMDFERMVDDWIFICFFVGNDFLPNIPSLEIHEGAIDRIVKIYLNNCQQHHDYLTDKGIVNFKQVQNILNDLGKFEDGIFQKRYQRELERSINSNRRQNSFNSSSNSFPKKIAKDADNDPQLSLADFIEPVNPEQESNNQSFDISVNKSDIEVNEEEDTIQFHTPGWKQRYYKEKFGVDNPQEFSQDVVFQYCRGLSWVMQYYFKGCPSWKWFYPYHYAPFASDFKKITAIKNNFPKNTKPFKPFEQLMAVFPASSRKFLPPAYQKLMIDPSSPIINFYPLDFKTDLNGKRWAWQGVTLLPFVSEKLLLECSSKLEETLTEEEIKRNSFTNPLLFCHKSSPLGFFIANHFDSMCNVQENTDNILNHDIRISQSPEIHLSAIVNTSDNNFGAISGLKSPIKDLPDLTLVASISCNYNHPEITIEPCFLPVILPNAILPPDIVFDPRAAERMNPTPHRHQPHFIDKFQGNYSRNQLTKSNYSTRQ
ncbi:MAG: 5'-3' exoribonuclease 2 [Marteilia pararefringens]